MKRPFFVLVAVLALLWPAAANSQPGRELVLATTTSTADSGLLDVLNPPFERAFDARVKVVALGTGAALRAGENGDADVVMVHARPAEDAFLRAGSGVNRRDVMFNDFVIVGPPDDPAGVAGLNSAAEAFRRVAAAEATFVSRGDDSGTHQKELSIWSALGAGPGGRWYLSVGKGMGDTLVQTDQIDGYTLSDRGTFLAMRDRIGLQVLVQGPVQGGDPLLLNPYGAMAVNPARHPERDYALAMAYIGYLTSPEAEALIEGFRVDGEPLFFPDAVHEAANFEQYVPATEP